MVALASLAGACGRSAREPLAALAERVPSAVAGWTAVEKDQLFDRDGLYDYIDGHAEVYLAYGFERCLARRYGGPEGEGDLVLDLFWMRSPADAFGVFTWDQEGEPVAVGQGGLLRPSWLSAWQGRCYLSLYAEQESPRAAAAMNALAAAVVAAVGEEGEIPALVRALPAGGLEAGSVRYVRSRQALAIQLGVTPAAAPPVEVADGVVLARYHRPQGQARVLLWAGPDSSAAERAAAALTAWVEGREGVGAVRRAETLVVAVHEATAEELVLALAEETAGGGHHGTSQ